ncbi:MAG: hypothetical protein P4M14_10125 [Gammaproteobacteria bacterium]|nr:hypothetical protein [Gammaproteobacteria bacterium]
MPFDVFAFKRIGQVVPSNNGKQVVFTVYRVKSNTTEKQWKYSLYLKNSRPNVEYLDTASSLSSINWSPDNKFISYLTKGNKFQSIWIYDTSNHKKQKLIEFGTDILSYKWSPNGKNITFTASLVKQQSKTTFVPMDVRNNYVNTRLYIFYIKRKSFEALTPDKLSVSQFFVYPGFDWSPDSQSIVFSYQPKPGPVF